MDYGKEIKQRKSMLRLALKSRNPERVASILNLPPILASGGVQQANQPNISKSNRNEEDYEQQIRNVEKKDFSLIDTSGSDSVATDWSSVLKALNEVQFYAKLLQKETTNYSNMIGLCFEAQSSLHSSLNQVFSSSSGNWLIPSLHTVCSNTYRIALLADAELGMGRNDHSRLENAAILLQESFSKTLNDRKELNELSRQLSENEGSKKAGVLFIVNQLFSMYFRLNKLRLCKNLVRPVERVNLHKENGGCTMGEMVTYRYYVGRLNTFEDQYEEAEKNLDFAFLHCHKDSLRNKRRILSYLLPVKLIQGRLPTKQLLEKYELHEFLHLVEGIRTGNLRDFTDGLLKYQDKFIRQGTYLLLEKCKAVCYRNLFKRVFLITGKTQLRLEKIMVALKWLETPMELDEIECILANLIYRGYIKGYIAHLQRVLVLSRNDPFPVGAVIK